MADGHWLDDLTRGLARATSRRAAARGVVAATLAALTAAGSPQFAPTKKNKGKNKRRKRKKQSSGGVSFTGSCSFDQGPFGSMLEVTVAGTLAGKPLTLEHHTTLPSPGDLTALTRVELSQQLVLEFAYDRPEDNTSRLVARYGLGFSGVQESVFQIVEDGSESTVGGSIDGRALVPRAAADVRHDPDSWQFEDGRPAPVLIIDPNQRPAVEAILARAGHEVAGCGGSSLQASATIPAGGATLLALVAPAGWLGAASAQGKRRNQKGRRPRRGKRREAGRVQAEDITVCDEVSDGCLSCWAGCFTTQTLCCAASLGLACGPCYLAYEECLDLCDANVCCPVECGNDFPSSCCCEGETCCKGNCCAKDESCCEGNCCGSDEVCHPGGVCCKEGREFCLGECCPQDTFCKEGICCRANAEPCFGECCPPGETCREAGLCCPPQLADCDGACCPSPEDACQGTVCCPLGQVVCSGECCPPDSICHPKDGATEEKVCCAPDLVCGDVCCDDLSRCIDPEHGICCGFALEVCAGVCCPDSGDVCVGRACCPSARACGETCCPPGHFCASPGAEPGAADCRPCDEGQIPCPVSVAGAPDCCPQNTQCCGDGTCCVQGVPCCDLGDGPRCNPSCIS